MILCIIGYHSELLMQKNKLVEAIATVHQAEVEQARAEIIQAVNKATDAWVSKPAICDALFLEFVEQATQCTAAAKLAAQLTEVANRLVSTKPHVH